MKSLPEPIEFNWDKGNSGKNERKHDIADKQAEEAFFDNNKVIYKDIFHSAKQS